MMNYYKKLQLTKTIRDKLLDEESRVIFDARIDYLVTRKDDDFINTIWPYLKNMYCPDLISHNMKNKNIIIFGSGHDGIRTKKILELCGYKTECFCDNAKDKVGKFIEGIHVISCEKLVSEYQNYFVVLASRIYLEEMFEQLLQMGFPKENIIFPRLRILAGLGEMQYFDVFKSGNDEVFVDAGAYNGETTKDFISWTNGQYKKIFLLEPLEEQFKFIKNRIEMEDWENTVICKKAAWNKKEELNFYKNDTGSFVACNDTGVTVDGESIDCIVGNERITFIKMDVEGSELNALEGATKTIQYNKPKLAISIYHKYEDIVELPLKILSIVPEYKFYLRHYSTDIWETVLYAVV